MPFPETGARGMVLALTLALLLLMGLMGATIILNSRAGLKMSSHAEQGRNAFASAETASQLAVLLSRVLLRPELGDPLAVISGPAGPALPLTVEINGDQFDLAALRREAGHDYVRRYVRAGREEAGGPLAPHMLFKTRAQGREWTVAAASVSLDGGEPVGSGMSLSGGDAYDGGGGGRLTVVVAVTVNARALGLKTRKGYSFDGGSADEPRGVITSLFREIM